MPTTRRLPPVEHKAGNEPIVQLRSMARPLDDPSDLDPLPFAV